ncbi:MAG: nucleotidyltransferase domain-containing protein [Anaerolineae bacterium]
MDLDIRIRSKLVNRILDDLRGAAPGSRAFLRGSLATERADEYSDIDILWEVPDSEFHVCVDNLAEILSRIGVVESLRSDPALQRSGKHRLFFARFEDMPLFWRADIEIFAESVQRDANYDLDNPEVRGSVWSLAESALSNAILALKSYLRDRPEQMASAIQRAYDRLGLELPEAPLCNQVQQLADAAQSMDPQVGRLAQRVKQLTLDVGTLPCSDTHASNRSQPTP